jgi:tetratricopeptide (TPR) repeat protein
MPETRTHDVIQVTMTDHLIRVVDDSQALLAPREKVEPDIDDILFLEPERAPAGDLGEIYRILGIVRPSEGRAMEPMQRLTRLLQRSPVASSTPYIDLARGLLYRQKFDAALEILEALSAELGETPKTLEWSAVALLGKGETTAAEQRLIRALELEPQRPEALFNLALILNAKGELDTAEARLRQALALRPNLTKAWFYLGEVKAKEGRPAEAADHYRRALQIDPTHTRAYLGIAKALRDSGQEQEALRYLRHGSRHARKPELVKAALGERPALGDGPSGGSSRP